MYLVRRVTVFGGSLILTDASAEDTTVVLVQRVFHLFH